ncbi:hypothetical protein SAMN04489740_2710 [Arthrobacter alpinus]|uniref:Uncharacterized protein n=1 Tax=Arthrobacter alpinus TaxID=656366 RepID=A0A1H5M348_9MICC|nr:hypothetical protein [Arthrobacter alpinus]SEE83187.1 hypothetical protein SAMN04489740_2710 [Arthrobacter alpinus]
MSTAPTEAIEAAARAIYRSVNRGHADTKGWDEVQPNWKRSYRRDATAAVGAAVPYVAAQALRDAADALEAGWAYGAELKSDGNEDRDVAAAMQMTHENAEELRRRADHLEGKSE